MANKPLLIIGGICVVLALASFGVAWMSGSNGIDDINDVVVEDYIQGSSTSFSFNFTDDDGQGSSGWYIMMDGEYLDADGDGRTDACQNVAFSVTDSKGVDVTEDSSEFSCRAPSGNMSDFTDEMLDPLPDDGRILFAYVCATVDVDTGYECSTGEEYTVTSDSQIYFMDHDELDLAYIDGLLGLLGSGLLGVAGSCCCGLGGLLLLIGLLTGGKPTPVIGYMPQQEVVPGMQVPAQENQTLGQMPQPQYKVGADIDSSSVADTPISVWDDQ